MWALPLISFSTERFGDGVQAGIHGVRLFGQLSGRNTKLDNVSIVGFGFPGPFSSGTNPELLGRLVVPRFESVFEAEPPDLLYQLVLVEQHAPNFE